MDVSTRLRAAGCGIAAGALGLGCAEFVAGLHRDLRSPVFDVGDRVVDRVPPLVKDLAIQWFGTNDKIALLVGIVVGLILFAALSGILAARVGLRWGLGMQGAIGALGAVAAVAARSGAAWYAPVPSITGAVAAAAALWWLFRDPPERAEPPVDGVGRRSLVRRLAVVGAGAVALGGTGRWLAGRFSAASSRAAVLLPSPRRALAEVTPSAQAPGAASFFTPNSEFYRIDTALTVPPVEADSWELSVRGMVGQELRLSYADLLARDLIEADITLACVSNTVGGELIGTARWLGTRLDDLLDEAGIDPAADQIVGRSVDGYTCGFPTAALDGRDALVAVGMNGEPLPLHHGFPARLIVPGIYGYASATKWLTEIELTTFERFDHYWVPRGYAAKAPIKLQSRIDTPRGLDRIPAGDFVIGGVAWAQTIGIDRVEVRIDETGWQDAVLADEVNDTTWRQWSLPWEATPGRHSIEVRATDRNGTLQTDERSEPLPDGASGRHTVVVLVDEA